MFENIHFESVNDFLDNKDSLLALIDNMEDGVSVLTPDLTVLYANDAMMRWYSIPSHYPNEKCYKLYHGMDAACSDCPAVAAMQAKRHAQVLEKNDEDNAECQSIAAEKYIITNAAGEMILIIGITRDITYRKALEKQVDDLKESFEILKKQNELLLSSLNLREKQFDELNRTIQENIENYVRPSLEHLKKKVDGGDINTVSSVIDSVVFPITKKRIPKFKELSPREMQVAAMVRDGYSSQQIAQEMYISKKAVDFHRVNIRRKLELPPGENLQRYLELHM